ncbi:hypothetical protein LTR37_008764 [Vermiconidia calcicola]|uniref:Uncharacterized protein n=1 Tax=Vermiconidia calcicola TaxID=1690605 RepID=A0ACC3NA27_9PEZI|nr:hypothetical protein LTR37_008764 [Vermiconidia calcicola]
MGHGGSTTSTTRVEKRRSNGSKVGSKLRLQSTASSPTSNQSTYTPVHKQAGNVWQDPLRKAILMAHAQSKWSASERATSPKVNDGPSNGPSPSIVSGYGRAPSRAPSQMSNRSYRGPVRNPCCVLSGFTKEDFQKGDIISAPFHTPNLDPNVNLADQRLTRTIEGPAYSKRRMLIVLWKYEQAMYCLPLFSFGKRGISAKPVFLRHEFVSVKNEDHDYHFPTEPFQNHGVYEPVEVLTKLKPLDVTTSVHIAGGVKLDCCEDIKKVGRLTFSGYKRLLKIWQDLSDASQGEPW